MRKNKEMIGAEKVTNKQIKDMENEEKKLYY